MLNCWNTMPILLAVPVDIDSLVVGESSPSKMTCPDVGISSRFRQRRKVDLPEPEGPMMEITSPL